MTTSRRRRLAQAGFGVFTYGALVCVLGPSIWLVTSIVVKVVPNWQWSVLTTPTQGTSGGLSQAIYGTLMLVAGVAVLAGSVGFLAGIWLAELRFTGRGGPVTSVLRTALEVLSGFPSIVLGYVGFVALVVGLHWGYSYLPAVIVLSVMVVPYIARATETALRQVPTGYREGAEALGMSQGHALRKVVLRTAVPGITTGLLIALAIACGETAPLLYTAGWTTNHPTGQLIHTGGFPYLTYPVFTFFQVPEKSARILSADAAFLLVVMVLVLLIAARLVVARTQRHSESQGR
jgi:phosphate transport system permease protein